jgi:hypothetical protein
MVIFIPTFRIGEPEQKLLMLMLFSRQTILILLLSLIGTLKASDDDDNNDDRADEIEAKANRLAARRKVIAINGPYDNRPDRNPYNNRMDGNPYNNRVDGNPYNNRVDGNPYNNRVDGNPYNNRVDNNPYNNRVSLPPPRYINPIRYPPRRLPCQPEKFEHPVIAKKYSDTTGYWILYTQILETRNVANRCHRNEYIYLAHRQKAGWFWNPRITSLVQYSLGEPKFIGRLVKHPYRPLLSVVVNMSRNYAPSSADLDRIFPKRLANEIAIIGSDDTKWSETAKTSLPILQMDTAYFQTVVPRENAGSQHLKILRDDRINREILE